MLTVEFEVSGMSCAHCERAVDAEVRQIPGVRAVEVEASTGRLVITADGPIADQTVLAAVDEAGYAASRV